MWGSYQNQPFPPNNYPPGAYGRGQAPPYPQPGVAPPAQTPYYGSQGAPGPQAPAYYQSAPSQSPYYQQPPPQAQPPYYQQPPRPYGSQQPQQFGSQPPQKIPQGWASKFWNQIDNPEMKVFSEWFQRVDQDHDGVISAIELQHIAFSGRAIGIHTARKLVQIFDVDGNGTIEFNEYATLHKFLMAMQTAFLKSDVDRSGTLEANEIHQALRNSGFLDDHGLAQVWFRKYCSEDAKMNFNAFLDMCVSIALVMTKFEIYDSDRDGRITFQLPQLMRFIGEI